MNPPWRLSPADVTYDPLQASLEVCFGTKFRAIGHKVANERSVIIMNHRTRIDWLFYMAVLLAYTQTTNLKIILKTQLKKAPCLGWAMQAACFVFLARQWVKDRVWLTSVLKYFSEMRYSFQLLLFPEGVNFCRVGKERSDAYAHKNDLPQYKYVLHPHTTGFSFTVDYLRETKMIDAVYDVTVGYCDVIPEKGELDIFNGNVPKEMQFLIQRYPIDALPQNREDLNNWCVEKWKEKERRLETFYTGSKTFEGQVPGELVNLSEQSRLFSGFVMAFWIASMLLSVWAMLTSTTVLWTVVLVMAVYVVLGKYFEGVDHLSIASFNFTQDLTHKARTT
ncbi:lysocardiolipin acyltransferase 1-like [Diadema antillarum]|uniref:lysocardiolipin acyltransferase 1-like n=1 Tax=Diadema antillarum TaxID=105358 RepID=UPI003A8BC622